MHIHTRRTVVLLTVAASVAVTAGIVVAAGTGPYHLLGTADPGTAVRLATPLLRLTADGCAVMCTGRLVLAAFLIPPSASGTPGPHGYAAQRIAARWALGWLAALIALLPCDTAATAGLPLSRVLSVPAMSALTAALGGPRGWLTSIATVAIIAIGARTALRWRTTAGLAVLAALATVPPLLSGHSSADIDHDVATAAIALHVPAAVIWLGSLVALASARLPEDLRADALRTYRRLSAGCAAIVLVTGIVDAAVLVPPSDLGATPYGLVVAATAGLGAALIVVMARRAGTASGPRVPAVEGAIMALVMALSAALTGLAPPAFTHRPATGEQTLLGYALAGPPTPVRLLFDARIDVVYGPLALLALLVYLAGVRRARRDGSRWPPARTASFAAGCLVLFVATNSGLNRYAPAMFSVQMAAHTLIGMLAPILAMLGAPITLAHRVVHSPRLPLLADGRPARALAHPLVASALFVAAPLVYFLTPLVDATIRYHWAHQLTDGAFLLIGLAFAAVATGEGRARLPVLARLGLVLAVMPADLILGAYVLGTRRIIGDGNAGANMYSALALPWVHSLTADQHLGGVLALALGEASLMVLLAAVLAGARPGGVSEAADLAAAIRSVRAATAPDAPTDAARPSVASVPTVEAGEARPSVPTAEADAAGDAVTADATDGSGAPVSGASRIGAAAASSPPPAATTAPSPHPRSTG